MEEIARFLADFPPFDQLPAEAVAYAAGRAQIEYFAANTLILQYQGEPSRFLYVICKGSVDLLRHEDGQDEVYDTLGPGEAFGYPSLIHNRSPIASVRAVAETLAYLIPAEAFHYLRDTYPAFANFFAATASERLEFATQTRRTEAAPALFQTKLRDLVRRSLVAISPEASVREAAQLMRTHNVSSLLVDLPPVGVLDINSGIITDRDLRNRVLAAALPDSTPVGEVMTRPITGLPADSLVFEGLLLMLEHNMHHLPVTEDGLVIGIVTHGDILRQQSRSPLFLPRQLERAETLEDLRHYTDQVADTVDALLDAGANVSDIGRVVALAHDALLKRILQGAEAEHGPPPVPYAWLVLGSEGRLEQTLRTDQDNALVYADDASPEAEVYFAALANQVVETLVACGFPRCPGNIMATNSQWRQPLSAWQRYFSRWIDVPSEDALLRSGIFFDYRRVHGELDVESAFRPIIHRAHDNRIFLARMARTTLRQPVPLTFFRQVALERRGEQRGLLDLKLRGTSIIVDLARLYALDAQSQETSTVARLRDSWERTTLGQIDAERLIQAFELISLLRLRHQCNQRARGDQPDNMLPFSTLSPLEQRELKESLMAVATIQRAVSHNYQTDLIG